MIKKFLLISLFIVLLLPIKSVLGAITYSRSPAGFSIQNPISFDVSFDTWDGTFCDIYEADGWSLRYGQPAGDIYSVILPTSTLAYDFVENLPLSTYMSVTFACYQGEVLVGEGMTLEFDGGENLFEVVGAGGAFFTLPTSTLTNLQANIGQLVTDTSLLWILAIALPLGFWLISKIIRIFTKRVK